MPAALLFVIYLLALLAALAAALAAALVYRKAGNAAGMWLATAVALVVVPWLVAAAQAAF